MATNAKATPAVSRAGPDLQHHPATDHRDGAAVLRVDSASYTDVGVKTLADGAQPGGGVLQRSLLRSQKAAGNVAVQRLLDRGRRFRSARPPLQRSPVEVSGFETLHIENPNGPGYVPRQFGSSAGGASLAAGGGTRPTQYQLERHPHSVDVTVRIKFIDPTGGRSVTGAGTTIPEDDERREFGTNMCSRVVNHWNGLFEFVSDLQEYADYDETNLGPDDLMVPAFVRQVRLPVRFSAVPVWDVTEDADTEVFLHAQQPDSQGGHPIDAANYYAVTNDEGTYTGYGDTDPEKIYAHEYGHLIGIDDEYSQSNQQVHLRMHAISAGETGGRTPAGTQMNAQLDRFGARQLMLAALRPRLAAHALRVGREASRRLAPLQRLVRGLATSGIRETWSSDDAVAGVAAEFETALTGTHDNLVPHIGGMLEQVTGGSLMEQVLANQAVGASLGQRALGNLVRSLYQEQVDAAVNEGGTVHVPIGEDQSGAGFGAGTPSEDITVRIDTADVDRNRGMRGEADRMARETVGMAGAAAQPSGQFRTELLALIGDWDEIPADLASGLADLPGQIAARAVAAAQAVAPTVTSRPALRRALSNVVRTTSMNTVTDIVSTFLLFEIQPMVERQMTRILDAVDGETVRQEETATSGPEGGGDVEEVPELRQRAEALAERARQLQAAVPSAGRPGHIRYSIHSLMGSNHHTDLHVSNDQMGHILTAFNAGHRDPDTEGEFRSEGVGS